ncbi:6-bladed beta-propeller [Fodinibius halophilus]|uniref:6-bladed beta-propeller n=1 Tax=Fodinibius halophilus TaxID=1736908 RepID=A0A6M1TD74_9BACT|nr:6-bladed beta-propeller [Fodinibius halophilus]
MVFVLASCQSHNRENNFELPDSLFTKHPEFTAINFSEKTKDIPIEKIAAGIRFVPLETTEGSLYKVIDDLFINDSLIVINARSKVLFFNRNGNHKYTFKNSGRGPGEFRTIYSFAVNFEANLMAIADIKFIKLYTLQGKFLKELKLPSMPFSLTPNIRFLKENKLIIENNRIKPHYEDDFSPLWIYNLETEKGYPIFKNYPDSTSHFQQKYTFKGELYSYQNDIRYQSRDTYNIYSVDTSENLTLRYKMDFGDLSMPIGAIHDAKRYRDYRERFIEVFNIRESKRYLFVKFGRDRKPGIALYDKTKKFVKSYDNSSEGFRSTEYPNLSFWPKKITNTNQLICIHSAKTIQQSKAELDIDENDNSVLSFIALK